MNNRQKKGFPYEEPMTKEKARALSTYALASTLPSALEVYSDDSKKILTDPDAMMAISSIADMGSIISDVIFQSRGTVEILTDGSVVHKVCKSAMIWGAASSIGAAWSFMLTGYKSNQGGGYMYLNYANGAVSLGSAVVNIMGLFSVGGAIASTLMFANIALLLATLVIMFLIAYFVDTYLEAFARATVYCADSKKNNRKIDYTMYNTAHLVKVYILEHKSTLALEYQDEENVTPHLEQDEDGKLVKNLRTFKLDVFNRVIEFYYNLMVGFSVKTESFGQYGHRVDIDKEKYGIPQTIDIKTYFNEIVKDEEAKKDDLAVDDPRLDPSKVDEKWVEIHPKGITSYFSEPKQIPIFHSIGVVPRVTDFNLYSDSSLVGYHITINLGENYYAIKKRGEGYYNKEAKYVYFFRINVSDQFSWPFNADRPFANTKPVATEFMIPESDKDGNSLKTSKNIDPSMLYIAFSGRVLEELSANGSFATPLPYRGLKAFKNNGNRITMKYPKVVVGTREEILRYFAQTEKYELK